MKQTKQNKVKIPISLKLVSIFSVLVIVILVSITYMVSTIVRDDERKKAEENNLTINTRSAQTIENSILNAQANANGFFNTLLILESEEDYKKKAELLFEDYCQRNKSTVFLYSSDIGMNANAAFLKAHSDLSYTFTNWLDKNPGIKTSVSKGEFVIKNISPLFNQAIICILFPHYNSVTQKSDFVAVAFFVDDLAEILSTGSYNTSFLINKDGDVLIHAVEEKMLKGMNVSYLEAVQKIKATNTDKSQYLLPDENGERWFYAFNRIVGDMAVLTCVSEADVFEAINRTTYRIILLSIAVLFLSIIIIRFFSKTISRPIATLVDATKQIGAGNYELDLKPKTKDEIGFLTTNFMDMTEGLSERNRLMNTFTRFTNKYIAEKAAKGELKPGGERKNATIFFSDIRSFTALSEKLTPDEVVEFLNEYFARMCECVDKTNGIVDKFIGDAVMAVWGAPESAGSAEADAWNAVKAALMMRIALYHLNQKRIATGKNPIKIGCGINTGPIVAGQIGSEGHMNYTVIGDTVNLASRTEALNKPFATDILITENTYKLIKDKIIVEEMPGVHVKGKTDAIKMYAVVNAVGVRGPADVHEMREFLGWDEPNLSKVSTDEEEKKYKIDG